MTEYVIQTNKLTRYFGDKCAADQVTLNVPRGSVFALMGRNGSGKTTIIRMLMGLTAPTRGSCSVLGCDSGTLDADVRSRIGYLTEGHYLFSGMRVRDCEDFHRGTFPKWNRKVFNAVIAHFALDTRSKVKHLSRGERSGLCLALTLAPEPELLVLDDPALGLDPVARRALVEAMLAVTSNRDRTILFSSHMLDDVERVADYVAIMDRSVLRVHCSVDVFRERVSRWVLDFDNRPTQLPPITGLIHRRIVDNELHLTIANPNDGTEADLIKLNPTRIERLPISLDHAVIDYLTDSGRSGTMLSVVGKPRDADSLLASLNRE